MSWTAYVTIHRKWNYQSESSEVESFIDDIAQKFHILPGSEGVWIDQNVGEAANRIPYYRPVAWGFCKVAFSINPYFSYCLFILAVRRAFRRYRENYLAYVTDDFDDEDLAITDPRVVRKCASSLAMGLITFPFWILIYFLFWRR